MPTRTSSFLSTWPWIVDPHAVTRDDGRQIDWTYLSTTSYASATGTVSVVVGAAGAAAAATSVPVAALTAAIPSGTVLNFGTNKFATLSAPAAAGATTLTTLAIPTALVSGDTATYRSGVGTLVIKAGTVMAELTTGKIIPRAVSGAVTATCILATDAEQNNLNASLSGYGVILGGVIYENNLPEATGGPPKVITTGWKTELQTAGVGTGFAFRQYGDTRVS